MESTIPKLEQEIEAAKIELDERSAKLEGEADDLDRKINKYTNWAWVFVWSGVGILVLGAIFYLVDSDEMLNLNLLGDFYGGTIASVWALAGLFLIYVAFLGQKKQLLYQQLEIKQSQMEVKYTRLELEGQKKEMMQQNETLRQQRFENTFFHLLKSYSDIVDSMYIINYTKQGEEKFIGKDAFNELFRKWETRIGIHFFRVHEKQRRINDPVDLEIVLKGLEDIYSLFHHHLDHYFRLFYRTIEYIEKRDGIDNQQYIDFFVGQISSVELIFIFYYGMLADIRKYNYFTIAEENHLFKDINGLLLFNKDHLAEYNSKAYGKYKPNTAVIP